MNKDKTIKITNIEMDAIKNAIYTQIDVLAFRSNKRDRDESKQLRALTRVLKKLK